MSGEGETREELLGLARDHGYEVTEHQLVRWHREGLLPRPKQRSLGKGHGTQTIYPPGAGKQLLRLCEIRTQERRLLHIAWRLWWEGYAVSSKPIRAFLGQVAGNLDEQLDSLVDPATGGLSETDWEELVEGSRKARLTKPLSRARRRVGSERMPTLVSIMLETFAGLYQKQQVDPVKDNAEDDTDGQVMKRGFGLDRGRTGRSPDPQSHLGKDLEATLEEGSRLFSAHSLSEVLAAATDEDLSQSRDQVRSVLVSIRLISLIAEQLPGSEAFALREMDKDARDMKPSDKALGVLLWAMWRLWGPLSIRDKMDSYHEEVQQVLSQLSELSQNVATAND